METIAIRMEAILPPLPIPGTLSAGHHQKEVSIIGIPWTSARARELAGTATAKLLMLLSHSGGADFPLMSCGRALFQTLLEPEASSQSGGFSAPWTSVGSRHAEQGIFLGSLGTK